MTDYRRRDSSGIATSSFRANDPTLKLVDQLVTSLSRRQIVGSHEVAVATARLVHTVVRNGKYTTIDELLGMLKSMGRRLAEANPKGESYLLVFLAGSDQADPAELASGNIIRRILRLIREEYRAAAAARISAPSSAPDTPYLGPTTPGLHAPPNHYLSNDLAFSNPSTPASRPSLPHNTTSLSNFVVMRHSRAQLTLERTGSILDRSNLGLAMSGLAMTSSPPPSTQAGNDLSASTASLFSSPSRADSADGLSTGFGFPQALGHAQGTSSPNRMDAEEFMRQSAKLKPVLLQAIDEVLGELDTTHEDVAKGAREHIHSSEIILTLGYSRTVEAFLKQAFKDRTFTVIVAESAPSNLGRVLAKSLSSSGVPTLLIPDSSVHALMPRITKLVIGCHSVLANGGLFGLSGTLSAVLAARSHSKPVVVATGQYKFAPVWNLYHDHGAFDFQGPSGLLRAKDGAVGEGVEVEAAYWEYIRPDLVDLFVTNEGDHAPSYIYRLIKESYDEEDVEL